MVYGISQFAYLVASACFIFALHWMNTPATARNGVYAGIAGTAIAILVTWADPSVIHHWWIVVAIAAGVLVGVPLSRVPLTAVPQRTALSHAFGGLAAGLVGTAEYYLQVSAAPPTGFGLSAASGGVYIAHNGPPGIHDLIHGMSPVYGSPPSWYPLA